MMVPITAILVPTTAMKVPITTMLCGANVAGFESNDLLGPMKQADGSDQPVVRSMLREAAGAVSN